MAQDTQYTDILKQHILKLLGVWDDDIVDATIYLNEHGEAIHVDIEKRVWMGPVNLDAFHIDEGYEITINKVSESITG